MGGSSSSGGSSSPPPPPPVYYDDDDDAVSSESWGSSYFDDDWFGGIGGSGSPNASFFEDPLGWLGDTFLRNDEKGDGGGISSIELFETTSCSSSSTRIGSSMRLIFSSIMTVAILVTD